MWEDPIVAEVHRIREMLAAEFNFDIKAFFADLRKRQTALGARLVSPKNRQSQALEQAGTATPISLDTKSLEEASAAEL